MINKAKAIYLFIAVLVGFGCSDTKKTAKVEDVQQSETIEQTTPKEEKAEMPNEPKKQDESNNKNNFYPNSRT